MPEVDMNRVARRRATSGQPICAALLAAVCWSVPAHAKEVPLWEFGLGAGAIAFEDYRGSNTTHAYPLPVPYVVYNGKFLKADRDGVRGTLFNQRRPQG
jgi:outer membrane protein